MSRRERRLLRRKGKKTVSKEDALAEEQKERKALVKEKKREYTNKWLKIYDTEYKKLILIPIILLLVALISIGMKFALTGEIVNKGVSLKGGVSLTVPIDQTIDVAALETYLGQKLPNSDVSVRSMKTRGASVGFVVDASDVNPNQLLSAVESQLGSLKNKKYSLEEMGSSLGQSFFKETFISLLFAFLFMGIVVFIYFRTLIPSLAVILAAFSDMVITLAIVNLIGIKLSTAGIAAFLMLIGYSVDTDILLTTRVLKRKTGRVFDRIIDAMKTGILMNVTTMIALLTALIFAQSEVLRQIMTILLIGLFVDVINTWLQNATILRFYVQNMKVKVKKDD